MITKLFITLGLVSLIATPYFSTAHAIPMDDTMMNMNMDMTNCSQTSTTIISEQTDCTHYCFTCIYAEHRKDTAYTLEKKNNQNNTKQKKTASAFNNNHPLPRKHLVYYRPQTPTRFVLFSFIEQKKTIVLRV